MNTLSVKNLPVLAGAHSGKRINYVPAVSDAIERLHKAAQSGNFYPLLAMKQLAALTTGFIGKANVYQPPENTSANHTYQHFDVYVPGIKARVERRSNDTYVVTYLELSGGWDQVRKGELKPGIYSVEKDSDGFELSYSEKGEITHEAKRPVVIGDGSHEKADEAAKDGFSAVSKSPFANDVKQTGEFDLVFSPIGGGLGGKQYNPASVVESYGNAAILAHAMIKAKDIKHVRWVSEGGGSAILTQAMQILANKKVFFNDSKHAIYMHKPKTARNQAVTLAHQLGMNLNAGHASLAYTPKTIIDEFSAKRLRVKSDTDSYSKKDYAKSLATYIAGSAGVVGVATYFGGFPAIAALLSPSAASAVTYTGYVAGGIGASGVVAKVSRSLCEDLKRGK